MLTEDQRGKRSVFGSVKDGIEQKNGRNSGAAVESMVCPLHESSVPKRDE